ncbi:MAG TPA: hypothetical protein VL866_24010 [Pyrinomonadaceae bacterium]|nr:hypothetical protein [Pyrinomonadaceae bacterium]
MPLHYQEEARIILQANREAKSHNIGSAKLMPIIPVDPYEM